MITRSKRDASYEHIELPDKKQKRQKKEKEQQVEAEEPALLYLQQPPYEEPNITIAYIERAPLYEVNIDFDAAHREWVKNKVKLQNGCYRYKKERKGKIQK